MYFVVDNFATGASRCVYSHRDTKKNRRPNLYHLMMDWPLFETDLLLDDPFSSAINAPLMANELIDPPFDDLDMGLKGDDMLYNDIYF